MVMKNLLGRLRKHKMAAQVLPEFGVRVTLRKGDKLVGRDTSGAIHVTRVAEDHVEPINVSLARPRNDA
jgi:hypothetical protein